MRENYGNHFLRVCVCVSVAALAATCLVYMSKMRQHTLVGFLCIVWTSLKTFPLEDMVLFACHDDR